MVEQEEVRRMRALAEAGWGAKRIASELLTAREVAEGLGGGPSHRVPVMRMGYTAPHPNLHRGTCSS